jgi:hypothetical protein
MVSGDRGQTFRDIREGLYTGPVVKEGARVRANANGTRFFVAANGALYVGEPPVRAAQVRDVTVRPSILLVGSAPPEESARRKPPRGPGGLSNVPLPVSTRPAATVEEVRGSCDVAVTARIVCEGAATPKSVTVDLSRLGDHPAVLMLDDGKHGDGDANDGVYGAGFEYDPEKRMKASSRDDWRRSGRGTLGLTVTAVGPDGRLAGAVGVLSVYDLAETFLLVDRKDFTVADQAWEQTIGRFHHQRFDPYNLSGYHALSFWIRGEVQGREEVFVQLQDSPPYSRCNRTKPVPIIAEKLIEGGEIAGTYRRVVIPMKRLLKDSTELSLDLVGAVVLSGAGQAPGQYKVRNVRFYLTEEDLASAKEAAPVDRR